LTGGKRRKNDDRQSGRGRLCKEFALRHGLPRLGRVASGGALVLLRGWRAKLFDSFRQQK
jgi:hypothetical protein